MSRHRQRRRGKAALGSLQQIFVVVEISSPYPNRAWSRQVPYLVQTRGIRL
jgi:hypothetical protein